MGKNHDHAMRKIAELESELDQYSCSLGGGGVSFAKRVYKGLIHGARDRNIRIEELLSAFGEQFKARLAVEARIYGWKPPTKH